MISENKLGPIKREQKLAIKQLFNHDLFNPWFKKSWLKSPGLKSSWLKSLGLKGPGLNLGVEKSRVEMSFNPLLPLLESTYLDMEG